MASECMRPVRIINRGRIAPSSPKPIIDSGRTSWSSASAVSTIDTKSPEPRITEEEVNQKLEKVISSSSIKKKVIIGLSVATVFLITVGVVVGAVVTSVSNKSPLVILSTTTTTLAPLTTSTIPVTTIVGTTTLPVTTSTVTGTMKTAKR